MSVGEGVPIIYELFGMARIKKFCLFFHETEAIGVAHFDDGAGG